MMSTATRPDRRGAARHRPRRRNQGVRGEGYHGTSTEDIARTAGISQPYLFRLFGSKKGLYIAAQQRCVDELFTLFAEAAKGKTGEEALFAMAEAYQGIMQDHDRMMLMLKSWATGDDPTFGGSAGQRGATSSTSPNRPRARHPRLSAASSRAGC